MTLKDIKAKFNDETVVELTPAEELLILHDIVDQASIDAGSSRAVYDWDDYVIKIGLSDEGRAQNAIEYDYYTNYDNSHFAILYAHGHFINVMEQVSETTNWELEDFNEDDYDETDLAMQTLVETVNDITGYDGGDNGQIGWSEIKQEWVCYDYGYSDNWDKSDIVGNMDEWECYVDVVNLAIAGIITQHDYTYQEIASMANFMSRDDVTDYDIEYFDKYCLNVEKENV